MIHFDHASTSLPRRREATAAALAAIELPSPRRGATTDVLRASAIVDAARRSVASLARGRHTTVFVSGATAALNVAIAGLAGEGDVIAIDPLAHNAVRRPAARRGKISVLPHDRRGIIDLARAREQWVDRTTLVVVTHASSVSGVVQPVAELVEIAHARGAKVVVDAAQSAGVIVPLDLGDADAIAFSAHKGLASLPGIGVLLVREGVTIEPSLFGGVGFDSSELGMPADLPERLEPGTPNLPGIAAMGRAAELATNLDRRALSDRLAGAVERAGLRVIARGDLPIVLADLPASTPGEVEDILDRVYGIRVRAGLHCAPLAHETLGTITRGAIRISAGGQTTPHDLDILSTALRELSHALGGAR